MNGKTSRVLSLAMSAAILLTNLVPPMQVYAEEVTETEAEEFAEAQDVAEDSSAASEVEERADEPENASNEMEEASVPDADNNDFQEERNSPEEGQSIPKPELIPEPQRYMLTIPFYEEASYAVDTQHIFQPENPDPDNKDTYLLYEADEKVEFSFYSQEEYLLTDVRVLDYEKHEYPFSLDEKGKVTFVMPDRDVFFYAQFEEQIVVMPVEEVPEVQPEDSPVGLPEEDITAAGTVTEPLQEMPEDASKFTDAQDVTADAVPESAENLEEMLPAEPEISAEETGDIPGDPGVEAIDDLQEDGETVDENPTDIPLEDALGDTADPAGSTDENDQDQPVETDEYTEVPAEDDSNIEGGENDGAVDVISEDFPYTEEVTAPAEEYPVDPETEERQEEPDISLTAVIEEDGLPAQGSIMSVDPVEVPLGSASFQSVLDFTNIQYDPELDQVELISDEVDVTTPGTYSTIYRITHNNGQKMWFVLRPIIVMEMGQVREGESASSDTASGDDASSEEDGDGGSEDEDLLEAMTEEYLEDGMVTDLIPDSEEAGETEDVSEGAFEEIPEEEMSETASEDAMDEDIEDMTEDISEETASGEILEDAAEETEEEAAEELTEEETEAVSEEDRETLEDVFEDESETETEEPQGEFKVEIVKGEELGLKLDHEDGTYDAGETVTFTTDLSAGTLLAASALKTESNEKENTEDILYSEVSYNAGADTFSFEMPAEDVALEVVEDVALGTRLLGAAKGDDDWDDATEVDAGYYYYYSDGTLHPFNSGMGSGGNDSYKYVRYNVNGKQYTVYAYCMQHSMTAPPSGTTYTSIIELDEGGDDKYLRKALFYGYGGPGWGGTFNGYNIKTIMENYGCTYETRAMQHYLVDYLYDGESGFGGYLSQHARNMLIEIKAALAKMPDPTAAQLLPGLSTKATSNVTETFTWKANEAFVITIHLEDGVKLVNETTGKSGTGNVKVKGGEKFHLEATVANMSKLDGEYQITSNYPLDFHAMLLKLQSSQDIGFGYYTDGDDLSLSVEWPDQAYATVVKEAKDGNEYNFYGCHIGLYSDQACTDLVKEFTTKKDGTAAAKKVTPGTYYVKEISVPDGWVLNTKVYTLKVTSSNATAAKAAVATVVNTRETGVIEVQKADADSGKTSPRNSSYSFTGMKVTIYSDSALTNSVSVLTTDANGHAKSAKLQYGTYYVRETTAPKGYEIYDHTFKVVIGDTITVDGKESSSAYLKFPDPPKKNSVEVQKQDKDTGKTEPYNGSYSFNGTEVTIYSDSTLKTVVTKVTTDAKGYGKSGELYYGTYYARETKAPAGYDLYDHTFTIVVGDTVKVDGTTGAKIVMKDPAKKKAVEVQKQDADTGKTTPYNGSYSFTGMEVTIYSDSTLKTAVTKITTDANGYGKSSELYYGTYYARETKAPAGYDLYDHTFTVVVGETVTVDGTSTVKIIVKDPAKKKPVEAQKQDADTGKTEPYNGSYSFSGMEVTIYSDSTLKTAVTKVTADAKGYGKSSGLYYGTYYARETKAPAGYDLYDHTFKVVIGDTVTVDGASTAKIIVKDPARKKSVEVQKQDADTGKTQPYNNNYSFNGMEVTIYSDSALKTAVTKITADKTGYGKSTALYYGTYYARETKAPTGYNIYDHTFTVVIGDTVTIDGTGTAKIIMKDPAKKKPVEIQKVDKDTGKTQPYNSSYSFTGMEVTIYRDKAMKEVEQVLSSDVKGYAKSKDLYYGTYYVRETKPPKGYDPYDHTYEVVIGDTLTVDGKTASAVKLTFTDTPRKKPVEVQKQDADTGKTEPFNSFYSFDGMEVTIYSDAACKTAVTKVTGDAKGYGKSTDLYYGTYYARETKAPSGYDLYDHTFTVVIDDTVTVDGASTAKIIVKDPAKKKPMEMQKVDKDTGKTEPFNKNYSFDKMEVTIYKDKACTQVEQVLTSNAKGYVKSKDLYYGIYYVKETKPPKGYKLYDHTFEVLISNDLKVDGQATDVVKLSFVDEIIRKPIAVQKYDKEKKTTRPNNTAVTFQGAEYTIYTDEAMTEVLEVLVTDENGKAESKPYPYENYYVKETKAPTGYLLDELTYKVVIDDIVTVNGAAMDVIENKKGIVSSYEQVIRGSISVMKYLDDNVEQSILQEWIENDLLKGIEFTLTHEDETVAPVKIVTDRFGHAETKKDELVYGVWTISETAGTPEGYQGLDEASMKVEENGVTMHYVITNRKPKLQVKLHKKDALTGELIPVRGAKFTISDAEGNLLSMPDNLDYSKITDTFTTNEEGVIVFPLRLEPGQYTVTETYAPEGFLLAEPVTVTLSVDDDVTIPILCEVEDIPQRGQVKVIKKDAETDETLGEGFAFDVIVSQDILDASGKIRSEEIDGEIVQLKAGTKADTIMTDETGTALTRPLLLGSYKLREVESGEYYALDDTEIPVELTYDRQVETVQVELPVKDKKTKFDLFKVDSDTDAPLGGITFRIFSSADKEAEKARQVAIAVEQLRAEQELVKQDLFEKQQVALANLGDVTEERRAEFIANQQEELAAFEAGLAKDREEYEKKLMAELEITDYSLLGSTYVTDENGQIHMENLLHGNTYTIYEIATLPGYNLDTTIHDFYVDENGLVAGQPHYEVKLTNQPNVVEISKKDITGDGELPGATLTLSDAEGNVVETWVSGDAPHIIKGLPAGIYTLTEEIAPERYALAQPITFELTDSLTVQQVTMYDEQLEIHFSKKEITGEKELPGAHLTLTDSDGQVVEEWVSTEEEHVINLKVGKYVLTETAPPEKYATAESIAFEVKNDLSVQKVEMKDAPIRVEVSKKDITTGKELPGAHLQVLDVDGNLVEEWDSTDTPHMMSLKTGTYTLVETIAPTGFATASVVSFEVKDTAEIQKGEMVDDITRVQISKTDITTGKELPGAHLVLKDSEGKVIEEWVSTEEPKYFEKLPIGTYVLEETFSPEQFGTAEAITFEVKNTTEIQKVEMKDAPFRDVDISKSDITTGKELPGAALTLTDRDGNVIDGWVSEAVPHRVKLDTGSYVLTEKAAPEGYAYTEAITFEVVLAKDAEDISVQKVEMKDAPYRDVDISKSEITTGKELPGAKLTVTDQEGKVVDEWTSSDTPHRVKLDAGTYTLMEVAAPENYAKAESITFEVVLAGEGEEKVPQKVEMKDAPYREVDISKTDVTNGKELPGAKLTLTDKDGKKIDEWISTEIPHRVKLDAGTYTLTEVTAPEGYAVSESITFEVVLAEEGEEPTVQKVEMMDSPLREVDISKVDITSGEELPGAQLTVTTKEGKRIDQWISTKEPHRLKLDTGTYLLTEVQAPDGYLAAETIEFEVEVAKVTGDVKVQEVVMKDAPYREVEISKTDITNGNELPGAKLTVKDEVGETVEKWTSSETPHRIKLNAGKYTLTEETAPDGYVKAETISFEVVIPTGMKDAQVQKVEMKDDVTKVEISKQDITTEKELPGAKLIIRDKDGKEIESWTSTKEPHYIEKLPVGKYTLTEITAPKGYDVAETIEFEVKDSPEVVHVKMMDKPKEELVDLTGKKKTTTTSGGGSSTPGTGGGGYTITTTPVKTGDYNRYLPAILLIVCGLASLAGVFVGKKKGRKREKLTDN